MTSGGKKDPTYLDDVFSTYLWEGNDESGRSISNGIKLSNNNTGNSVYLNGTNSYLSIPSSSDFAFGTGDFTWEGWFYLQDDGSYLISFGADVGNIDYYTYGGATRRLRYYNNSAMHQEDASTVLSLSTWYHIAAARSSNTTKVFLNGTEKLSFTDNKDYGAEALYLGATSVGGSRLTGNISNVRIVKGQALYTSNFTPSTQALTTTSQGATASNVKLLCCNKSTPTGATVTPGTITTHGTPESQGFGPFTGNDGEGGLVWIKNSTTGHVNVLFDTVRGANQRLRSDSNLAQTNTDTLQPLFTNSGFTVGGGNEVNGAGNDYTSWTWRKQKEFFDIVSWTGNGSNRTIAHNLGSVPGCIMVKRTDATDDWVTYHRGISDVSGNNPGYYYLYLNTNNSYMGGATRFNNTAATASEFTVGTDTAVNANGGTYVAYVFAGGASDEPGAARSVDFDGTGDYLSLAASNDLQLDGDFTIECWVLKDRFANTSNRETIFGNDIHWTTNFAALQVSHPSYVDKIALWDFNANSSGPIAVQNSGIVPYGSWNHIAVVRSSNVIKIYSNGTLVSDPVTSSATINFGTSATWIGATNGGNSSSGGTPQYYMGNISNLRVVKGTAVYTDTFKPPTVGLTNITNTKLLCCNKNTVTGSTVTTGTITSNGNPQSSITTPFDDPAGFKFGEDGDQNIIKCGFYKSPGSNPHTTWDLNIGWEPQWILIKNAMTGQNWTLVDSMRGLIWDDVSAGTGYDRQLHPNTSDAENGRNICDAIPNGVRISSVEDLVNGGSQNYVYIAIRRPDGLVGKPPEAGTDVFAMDYGSGSSNIPTFDSGFPVDFGFYRIPTQAQDFTEGARLTGTKYLLTNATNSEADNSYHVWDSNVGWSKGHSSSYLSWMWKRHAGFDVVTWKSGGSGETHFHGLGKAPEMIWIKNRSSTSLWRGGHKGLNGGTNPWTYGFTLNNDSAEFQEVGTFWNGVVPSATSFSTGSAADAGGTSGDDYIAMLFASVDGISKVGSYTGTSSNPSVTITTGFSPRFLLIKRVDASRDWCVFDTLRGIGSGSNDYKLRLNSTAAQSNGQFVDVTSTGFTAQNVLDVGTDGGKYIYYAHA